jgi:hypothetical protein
MTPKNFGKTILKCCGRTFPGFVEKCPFCSPAGKLTMEHPKVTLGGQDAKRDEPAGWFCGKCHTNWKYMVPNCLYCNAPRPPMEKPTMANERPCPDGPYEAFARTERVAALEERLANFEKFENHRNHGTVETIRELDGEIRGIKNLLEAVGAFWKWFGIIVGLVIFVFCLIVTCVTLATPQLRQAFAEELRQTQPKAKEAPTRGDDRPKL